MLAVAEFDVEWNEKHASERIKSCKREHKDRNEFQRHQHPNQQKLWSFNLGWTVSLTIIQFWKKKQPENGERWTSSPPSLWNPSLPYDSLRNDNSMEMSSWRNFTQRSSELHSPPCTQSPPTPQSTKAASSSGKTSYLTSSFRMKAGSDT